MPAPAIPPSTITISPALLVTALLAQNASALSAVLAGLPTSPDGLSPGQAWNNNNSLAFIPQS
jgi:hypothetical protein